MRSFRSFLVMAAFAVLATFTISSPAATQPGWHDDGIYVFSAPIERFDWGRPATLAEDTAALRAELGANYPAATDDQMPYRLKPEYLASLRTDGANLNFSPHLRC